MQQLLTDVVEICRQAGEAILEVYRDDADIDVQIKADDSPVTRADMAAHRILEPGLRKLLPGVPVLSEEGGIPDYEVRRQWQRYWLVDPLDGTKEFIHRNDEFTVNVALIDKGEPVLGVIYVPVSGISYTGLKAAGAHKIVRGEITSIAVRDLAGLKPEALTLVVVASRRHGNDGVARLLEKLRSQVGEVVTRNMGSSLKLCLVAEGAADIYPRLAPTCEWDTAAAQAIVEAAGGAVLGPDLRPLGYNRKESLLNPDFFVVGDRGLDWQGLFGLKAAPEHRNN